MSPRLVPRTFLFAITNNYYELFNTGHAIKTQLSSIDRSKSSTRKRGDDVAEILVIRARLRKRDRDIKRAVSRLDLEEGQMSDLVRKGFRKVLVELGVMETVDDLETAIERSVE